MNYFQIISIVITLLAFVSPFFIAWFQKKDKINKTNRLIRLLKTKEELIQLLEQKQKEFNEQDDKNNSQILIKKFEDSIKEIDKEIYPSESRLKIKAYIIIIAFEMLLLFSLVSKYFIAKSSETGLLFTEGIFEYSATRIILLLIIIIISFFLTQKTERYINGKIKSKIWFSTAIVSVFNIIWIVIAILSYFLLVWTDPISPWY